MLATRPICTGSLAVVKTMGGRRDRRLYHQHSRSIGDQYRHPTINELKRDHRHSIVLPLRPAVLDRNVLALDIAGFL
jgi:hypothetical protein